jgi:hypothetical protein
MSPFGPKSAGRWNRAEESIPVYTNACDEDLRKTTRELLGPLEENSPFWGTLRLLKLVLEVIAAGFGVWLGGLTWWPLLFVPLLVSLVHLGFEVAIAQYVDTKRRRVRAERLKLLNERIVKPFEDHWIRWPQTLTTPFARLTGAVSDLPRLWASLKAAVDGRTVEAIARPTQHR